MSLKDTVADMKQLLEAIVKDLDKAVGGNKAASQRVRTGTIKLEKVAKAYRKESVGAEKKVVKSPKKAAAKVPAKHSNGASKGKVDAKKPMGKVLLKKK